MIHVVILKDAISNIKLAVLQVIPLEQDIVMLSAQDQIQQVVSFMPLYVLMLEDVVVPEVIPSS